MFRSCLGCQSHLVIISPYAYRTFLPNAWHSLFKFLFQQFFQSKWLFCFLWIQANQSIVVTRNCLEKAAAELEFLWSLGETQHEYVQICFFRLLKLPSVFTTRNSILIQACYSTDRWNTCRNMLTMGELGCFHDVAYIIYSTCAEAKQTQWVH